MLTTPDDNPSILSVTELTEEIKLLIEDQFSWIQVRGEVSQPKTSRNGHLYFTLKDGGAQLSCVIWNARRKQLNETPLHGQEVVTGGALQVYAPHGRYQMIVEFVREAGPGALQLSFERLKNKLEKEGLFDPDQKRDLPKFPAVIGIITSSTGAAFQDMRITLEVRYPLVEVRLYHASVQGLLAAPEITEGIRFFSRQSKVDLLIIARGGGSLEDLWAFNEESVARAIAECPIPVISAVGHETDFSISDFVADARAATPTQAIVMAVPDINDLRLKLDDLQMVMEKQIRDALQQHKNNVSRFRDNFALHKVKNRIQHSEELLSRQCMQLNRILEIRTTRYRERLRHVAELIAHKTDLLLLEKKSAWSEHDHRLISADPNTALKKGYTRIYQKNQWIRAASDFVTGQSFEIEWSDKKIDFPNQKSTKPSTHE